MQFKQKYVEAIIDQLNDRFPNAELLSAVSIFDPHSLPSDEDELATYGQLSVDIHMVMALMRLLMPSSVSMSGKASRD